MGRLFLLTLSAADVATSRVLVVLICSAVEYKQVRMEILRFGQDLRHNIHWKSFFLDLPCRKTSLGKLE